MPPSQPPGQDPSPVPTAPPPSSAGPDTRRIAERLAALYTTPFLRHYVYWKVRTDPLYPAVSGHLEEAGDHPLVDLGCGPGLFAFYLKSRGQRSPLHGLDVDAEKIRAASAIAAQHWPDLTFRVCDFAHWDPAGHQGHVTLLDVLQYLPHDLQDQLLQKAARCLTDPAHRLIIRNGLDDDSWRASVTRVTDHLARWIRWMARSPRQHPSRQRLEHTLTTAGLRVEFQPLWGATPFNNYLIIARR